MSQKMKSKNKISTLTDHLGYWLRFVSNHVSHTFAQKLMRCDVTVAEWVVLRELHESAAVAPSDLAERLGLTRGAVSKLIDRLEAKMLVMRTVSQDDKRYQSVALSSAGTALVPDLCAIADENDATFFGHLSPAEREGMTVILREIIRRQGVKTIPMN